MSTRNANARRNYLDNVRFTGDWMIATSGNHPTSEFARAVSGHKIANAEVLLNDDCDRLKPMRETGRSKTCCHLLPPRAQMHGQPLRGFKKGALGSIGSRIVAMFIL